EPPEGQEQLIARMEVVGKHAAPALYNAVEHRRIPFRFVWMPLAAIQEGLGGKARAIVFGILAGIALLLALCLLVSYPLKMDANGSFLPLNRRFIYSPVSAHVSRFDVEPGETVRENQSMILMYDLSLDNNLSKLNKEIDAAQQNVANLDQQLTS